MNEDPVAERTGYRGQWFDSKLEATWAETLDYWGLWWEYHPGVIALSDGTLYEPDFRVAGVRADGSEWTVVLEVKGEGVDREWKVEQAQAEMPELVFVIGREAVTPATDWDSEQALAEWEPGDVVLGTEVEGGELVWDRAERAAGWCWTAWPRSVGELRGLTCVRASKALESDFED